MSASPLLTAARRTLFAVILVAGFTLVGSVASAQDTTITTPPTTEPPTTEPPTTEPPTTEPPTTESPTTESPTTEPDTTTTSVPEEEGGGGDFDAGPWILLLVGAGLVAIVIGVIAGGRARSHDRAATWSSKAGSLFEEVDNVAMHAASATPTAESDGYDGERLNALTSQVDGLARNADSDSQRASVQQVRSAMSELSVALGARARARGAGETVDDADVMMRANLLHQAVSSGRAGLREQ
jgi:hypothetical protein